MTGPSTTSPGSLAADDENGPAHVAFFLPNLNGGGAQKVLVNLASGLADRGHPVDIVVTWATGELHGSLPSTVDVVELDPPRIPVLGSAASIPGLVRYLERASPAVLYAAMAYANVSAIAATYIARTDTSVVASEHTMTAHQTAPKDRVVNWLAGYLYQFAGAVVAVSEGVGRALTATTPLDSGDVTVINNPILTEDFDDQIQEPIEDEWIPGDAADVVVSAGRLAPEKDFETLLRAVARLTTTRDIALVVLGEGPERDRLQALARELGVQNRVSFPGYVDNPYKYMREASVFVLSSRFEGLPTVLVEAMACGCPVVSTDCPSGPREILRDGQHGPLVPVGDDEALADAIDEILTSPPDPVALRTRAEDFATDVILDEYAGLIEALREET